MPPGLQLASKLAEPIFTPSTKATEGHDRNIDFAAAVDLVGSEAATSARAISLELYTRAAARAAAAGFVLADTKFELGYVDGALSLCDEVCTPDSSRLLAGGPGRAGHHAARVRQAAAARLARRTTLGPHAASAVPAPGGDDGHVGALRRGLRARHRSFVG